MSGSRRPYAPRMPLEQRRQQLFDATLSIIRRDGYGGLSIDAIAQEAHVTRPVVYGAFGSLDDLLSELTNEIQAKVLKQLLAAAVSASRSEALGDRVENFTRSWIELVRSDAHLWALIVANRANTPQVVLDSVQAGRDIVGASLGSLFAAVPKPRGEANPQADLGVQTFMAAARHYANRLVEDPDGVDDEALIQHFRELAPLIVER